MRPLEVFFCKREYVLGRPLMVVLRRAAVGEGWRVRLFCGGC